MILVVCMAKLCPEESYFPTLCANNLCISFKDTSPFSHHPHDSSLLILSHKNPFIINSSNLMKNITKKKE